MSITSKELAKLLGISEAAVSMALNGKPGVSAATKNRVIEAAKAHGYDFSRITEKVSTGSSRGDVTFAIYKKHGAIVADTPFFNQLTEGIESACKALKYRLHISYLYDDGEIGKQIDALPIYDGIILLGTEMKSADFTPFERIKVPIVVLDTYFHAIPYDCVIINNFQGAFTATEHLIKRIKGHPGYLKSSYQIGNFDERADGFFSAVRAAGLSASRSPVIRLTPSLDGAYRDMLDFLEQGEKPVAGYFADNDNIAAGAMKALLERGYRVPEDVSIIGFDDMPFCTYLNPPLSTVNVPKDYLGKTAVDRLAQIIADKGACPLKIEVSTKLVKRKSVMKTLPGRG